MITLVTGATGLMGNNIVRLLRETGDDVRVLVRGTSDPRPLAGLDVEVVTGDIRDVESVRRAMPGVGRVVHAAARVGVGRSGSESQRTTNVDGTRNVAGAARDANARMVLVSSISTMGDSSPGSPADEESPRAGHPPDGYAATKRAAEETFLQEVGQGLDGVVVNPGVMFGPWDWKPSSGRMVLAVARRFTPLAPRGGCSVCDVRDVAAGILAALDRGTAGRHYILAGENVTYLELWQRIAQVTGASAPVRHAGPFMSALAGAAGDAIGRITGREPDLNSASVRTWSRHHYLSSVRAQRELGYAARPIEESIADAWNWFQAEGYT